MSAPVSRKKPTKQAPIQIIAIYVKPIIKEAGQEWWQLQHRRVFAPPTALKTPLPKGLQGMLRVQPTNTRGSRKTPAQNVLEWYFLAGRSCRQLSHDKEQTSRHQIHWGKTKHNVPIQELMFAPRILKLILKLYPSRPLTITQRTLGNRKRRKNTKILRKTTVR